MFLNVVKSGTNFILKTAAIPLSRSLSTSPVSSARSNFTLELFPDNFHTNNSNGDQFSKADTTKTLEVPFNTKEFQKKGFGHVIENLLNKGIALTKEQQEQLKKLIENQLNPSDKKK